MTLQLPTLPFTLAPSSGSTWTHDAADGSVSITAPGSTDIFIDPAQSPGSRDGITLNAPTLLADAPDGDFRLSARVSVAFTSTFDAGVLLLWLDERHWAKLCFEQSPDELPTVVTVVAREVADDANAFIVDATSAWLRISRTGRVYAFHASVEGERWQMVRAFALESNGATARIGFEAQSPTGAGCDVRFDEVAFDPSGLTDLRDGS